MSENKLKLMLQQIVVNAEINLNRKNIANHSACHTAIRILKAFDVPVDEAMIFSDHCSCEVIWAYNDEVIEKLLNPMPNSSNQSQELVNPCLIYQFHRPILNLNQSLLKPFKSPLINNKKMQLEQTMQLKEACVQESKEAQVQESRKAQVQESSEAQESSKSQVHKAIEAQVQKVREAQAQNQMSQNNQLRQVIEHYEDKQALMPNTSKE
ncbi:10641_t:CDS:2 [Gigaspora margarita]|uniref:10641_t:CDS:1 n=1 Tax=Gigaspora margarita TaxID=4874 RepID=A0ABM8W3Z6_GIGMA|nr:10641_t:CDS:2 [Gigaspora margarita]